MLATLILLVWLNILYYTLMMSCLRKLSGVLGGIRGYTAYTNLRVFLTAYTHLSDHKSGPLPCPFAYTHLHF